MSAFIENVSYRPFQYEWAAAAAKHHSIDMYWDIHNIELQDDIRQFNTKDGLKTKTVSHDTNEYIIRQILCLFTELDRSVGAGYVDLLQYVKNNELRSWFLTAAQRETVHQRAYALLAENFGFMDRDWSAFIQYQEMREKLDVMASNSEVGRDEYKASVKLATILLGEGIGLFAPFTYLLNFKRFGRLMGFNDVNTWSLTDEQDHVDNNIKALNVFKQDLNPQEVADLNDYIKATVRRYVDSEVKFIHLLCAKGDAEDLKAEDVIDYIEFLGEFREFQLGLRTLSDVRPNKLTWMEWMLTGLRHDSFFEKKVGDYVHKNLEGRIDYTKYLGAISK